MAGGRGRRIFRKILIVLGILAGLFLLAAFLFWVTLPDPSVYAVKNPELPAIIRYREAEAQAAGKPLRRLWKWVPLKRISKNLVRAVISTEDDKFYQHHGFDWEAIGEAWEKTLETKRITRGGSTITQQCAKNLYLSPERSFWRKAREAAITWYMERNLSKDRILEIYLNIIEWGDGIYGIEAAAQHYFHKSAASLGVAESVRLASVIANPHIFNPLDDSNPRMRKKRAVVAYRMSHRGWGGRGGSAGLLGALKLRRGEQEEARREYPEEFKESAVPAELPKMETAPGPDDGAATPEAAPAPEGPAAPPAEAPPAAEPAPATP